MNSRIKMTPPLFVAICLVTLLPSQTEAQTTITFDDSGLDEGDLVINQFEGVTFEGAILAEQGFPRVAYGVAGGLFADTTNDSPFIGPFITDPVVDGSSIVTGTIEINFPEPANSVQFWVADIHIGDELNVAAFDSENGLLGTDTIAEGEPGTGDGIATLFVAPWNGIVRLEVVVLGNDGFSGWGLDTLSFTSVNDSILGDVNGDGNVDLLDVAPFVELLTDGGFQTEADINQDGSVDLLDVAPFVSLLSGN